MIEKPKKERRFLKTLGKIGEILIQEVLIKIGSNLIKKIGGKKTLPSILFLLASLSLFAQYPATGNKQRLGYQTTGDGLLFRGRASDTTTIKSSGLNNAYFILDTVNNVLFNYIKTKGGWVFNNTDTVINNITVDTTSLSNRINLKLNISDTASMLAPYFKDLDTTSLNLTSRFGAKLNISDTASMLTNYLRTGVAASTYLPLAGGTVTGNTNFVPTTGRVIFGETSPVWDEVLGVRPRTTTSLGLGIYSSSASYSGTLFRAQSENSTGSSYMLYEGRGNGGSAKFWIKGDGSSFFAKNMTIGSQTNYDALNVHHSGDEGFRMSYSTEPTIYFFQIRTYQSNNNVRYVFSQTNANTFYDSILVFNQGNIAINKLNPAYKLDVNGTLGVTGATTLSAPLTVNSSAVFNEGSTDSDFRVESDGNVNMVFVDASTDRVGIGTNAPTKTLDVDGTLVVSGIANFSNQMTISGSVSGSNRLLGKNTSNNGVGDITIGTGLDLTSNNLTASGTDTTSLSNRINLKYDKTGGTISGAVTLSTTTATPTALLGKDGSNVVGTVTTLAQTGLMKAGGTTTNTSSVGIITVAHGLSYTPSQVFVTLAQQSNYIAVCHAITSTDMSFTFYNSTTGIALNNVSVGFFWLAIK